MNAEKTILSTAGAVEISDPEAERLHGPPNELETYYNESGTAEISLLTDEREEFETDEEVLLEADVIPDELFNRLTAWCRETFKNIKTLGKTGWE